MKRRGLYDIKDRIIIIGENKEKGKNLSCRIHVATHELTHWAFHSQPTYEAPYLDKFRRLLEEGVTEQVALETSFQLITTPDLIQETRRWFNLDQQVKKMKFINRCLLRHEQWKILEIRFIL